jgi:hypothetical protein
VEMFSAAHLRPDIPYNKLHQDGYLKGLGKHFRTAKQNLSIFTAVLSNSVSQQKIIYGFSFALLSLLVDSPV